jgi:hypothetical protein
MFTIIIDMYDQHLQPGPSSSTNSAPQKRPPSPFMLFLTKCRQNKELKAKTNNQREFCRMVSYHHRLYMQTKWTSNMKFIITMINMFVLYSVNQRNLYLIFQFYYTHTHTHTYIHSAGGRSMVTTISCRPRSILYWITSIECWIRSTLSNIWIWSHDETIPWELS